MKRLALAAVMALTALVALSAFGQNPPPKFGENIDVNLVVLDAVVTDSRGHQILGLDKNNFVVKENGVVQPVESVEYFTNRTLLNATEENAPFQVERTHDERYYIFFFDKPEEGRLWDRLARARGGAKDFVNAMKPGDRIAVVAHDVRLKVYSDFTNDKAQLIRALDEVAGNGRGLTSGDGPMMKAINSDRMMSDTGTPYQALDLVADAVHGIRGRKDLILFSPGIVDNSQQIANGMVMNESRYYEPMIDSLNAANVTVHALNIQEDFTSLPFIHQTLEQIAGATNGEYYRDVVTFGPLLKRIEQQTNGYYVITYYAHHPRGSSGFQKVKVSLTNPEMRVKARTGYSYGG
ncbi:MAG TPA: VWA domain-containing protein [Thermoanaerobaculia bacterium]|jgi:VWFA-related protein|nr:VWA domain-containing protein [Thermoanaerobaculia bacterium]